MKKQSKRGRTDSARHVTTSLGAKVSLEGSILRVTREGVKQSHTDLSRPGYLDFEYLQHMDLLVEAFAESGRFGRSGRVMHVGAGGCTLPLAWLAQRPWLTQVAIDVDAELLDLVRDWASLARNNRLRLRVGDGRQVLEGSQATYDIIVRDAFEGGQTPAPLASLEWTELASSRLRTGGVYLANVGHDQGRTSKPEVAAIAKVFPHVAVIADPKAWKSARSGNLTVAAWHGAAPQWHTLERWVRSLPLPTRLYRPDQVTKWLAGSPPMTDSR